MVMKHLSVLTLAKKADVLDAQLRVVSGLVGQLNAIAVSC